jgi:alanine transaminase
VVRVAQIMTGLMINQPKAGEPSYELFNKEQTGVYDSLKRKAKMLVDALNDIDGFSCQTVREHSEGRGSDCGIRTEGSAHPSSREFVDHPGGTQLRQLQLLTTAGACLTGQRSDVRLPVDPAKRRRHRRGRSQGAGAGPLLLEETGICCVPGSGFLQKPGTYHFRTTFLPPEEKLAGACPLTDTTCLQLQRARDVAKRD